ncbi:tRNA (5-methylaminomethyl-2-thiouridine)(34)-methyltransferase MnmD [Hydrogenimonas sp.]
MPLDLVQTGDGSYTCRSRHFDECYHSTKDGALQESMKKHVEPAFSLSSPEKEKLTILDICFGLGYNTLAAVYYAKEHSLSKKLHILSPEFDEKLVRSLSSFPYPQALKPLTPIIESIAKEGRYEDERIRIELYFGDAREFLRSTSHRFDIVFQDAFSPKKNPLLWTKEYFAELAAHLAPDAVVTTYSCATPVRMGMVENGLFVYHPETSGVRSGTIASPSPHLALKKIDMALKKARNPAAASLSDSHFI